VVGVSQNRVRLALARRSEELGIGRCSPNSLRRHVVDALYESAGADPKAAGAQLGHSEQTAITHYRQVSEDRKREVVEGSALGVVLAFPSTRKLEEVG
jgi:integrase